MSTVSKPNFMRYKRVADVVATEPLLMSRLGNKREVVLKPNGEEAQFATEIVNITEHLHATGHDASTVGKNEILSLAGRVILDGERFEVPEFAVKETPPSQSPPEAKTKRAKIVRLKVSKPKKAKKKKTAVAAVQESAEEATVTEKTAEEPPPAKTAKSVEAPAPRIEMNGSDSGCSGPVVPVSPPMQARGGQVPFAVGIAISSLLIAASQLLEIHDKTETGRHIRNRLDTLITEAQARVTIPSSRG